VTKTAEIFGPLDIFVSNAGILTMGTIDTYSLEDFDRMVAINIRAAFIGTYPDFRLFRRSIAVYRLQLGKANLCHHSRDCE
jgi:NAD(P)-dependent dehydrogenase (short-subunit alcohol dehydrogenase family)